MLAHKFQSTLPVWGATLLQLVGDPVPLISIHAPRVGSDSRLRTSTTTPSDFNPRSPCGERQQDYPDKDVLELFQSTLPVWGATVQAKAVVNDEQISIHAPRVGSDSSFGFS